MTELTGTYQGFDGGLYGGGRNSPPPALALAGAQAATRVVPRDRLGQPAGAGAIGLLAIGPSVTRLAFGRFQDTYGRDPRKAGPVVLINGAQNEQVAQSWAAGTPWKEALRRVQAAGMDRSQVQVVWFMDPYLFPQRLGGFPAYVQAYARTVGTVLGEAERLFPNLQLVYLSSGLYTGYQKRPTMPEPYSYEGVFALRQVIAAQDVQPGRAPVILFGPYLWADGLTTRASDGLTWSPHDFWPDGTHPSGQGQQKIADALFAFLTADPTARPWFVAPGYRI